MTEAMPFLQKYDITFLRPPPIAEGIFYGVTLGLEESGPTEGRVKKCRWTLF